MTPQETALLLAKAVAYDSRTVGRADIAAWQEALGDLDFHDAMAAVVLHFQDSTDRLMPAHIRRCVKTMREERLRGVDILDLGSEDDVETYIATVRRRRDDIAAGRLTPGDAFREIETNYRRREITTGGQP